MKFTPITNMVVRGLQSQEMNADMHDELLNAEKVKMHDAPTNTEKAKMQDELLTAEKVKMHDALMR